MLTMLTQKLPFVSANPAGCTGNVWGSLPRVVLLPSAPAKFPPSL